jgi:hypothetical protein
MRLSFIIVILFPAFALSQSSKEPPDSDLNIPILYCIEDAATVDLNEWSAYLTKSLVLNDSSLDTIPAGTYTVRIQFVIDKKGKINNVSVQEDPGHGLGQRVVKAIADYTGTWQPEKDDGRAVSSYHVQPITFIVEEPDNCEEELPASAIL